MNAPPSHPSLVLPAPTAPSAPPPKRWRRLRWVLRAVGGLALLLVLVVLFWLRHGLYHRWVSFPREKAAWEALRVQRQPVTETGGWTEYRGILHSHSKFSHDSEVPFEDILTAMKTDGLDFICLSDHPIKDRADFDWQWRGLHEGRLFIPGFEMNEGMMPFGVRPGVVLDARQPEPVLAAQIAREGGVLFFAHSEEPRHWDEPNLTGMEIYNIHSDLKRHKDGLPGLLPDVLLSLDRYPEQIFHSLFRRPTDFLTHWDELNRTRHLTGIAGNDCHQNVGLRAFCTSSNTVWIEDTSPRKVAAIRLHWYNRPFLRLLLGPLTPGRKLFHVQLDPYARSAHFVNTHVLAHELTEPAILEALRTGRVFIGFDLIADSSGFRWLALGPGAPVMMGEAAPWTASSRLQAFAPLPCRFTVMKDGRPVHQVVGRQLDWPAPGPGKYRVEAEVEVLKTWVPWVYANPIELK